MGLIDCALGGVVTCQGSGKVAVWPLWRLSADAPDHDGVETGAALQMIIQVSSLEKQRGPRPLGSSSLIELLAVHADRLDGPLPAQRRTSLVAALTAVPDRRDPRDVVHALPAVLTAAVAAVLTGARSAAAVAEWAADAPQQVLAELGVFRDPFTGVHRAPDESTFRRILAGVDADALDDAVGRWILASRPSAHTGRRVYSVDGKTLRGSGRAG